MATRTGGRPSRSADAENNLDHVALVLGSGHVGDLQAFVLDRVDDDAERRVGLDGPDPLAVVVVGLMEVSSLGSVAIGKPTPQGRADDRGDDGVDGRADDAVSITTGALQSGDDRRRLRAGVRHIADLLRSPEMTPMIEDVLVDDLGTPLDQLLQMSDEQTDRWIADHPGPYAHPAGSCPMGPASSPASVVGCEAGNMGRLHGYEGIYLADASVLPDLVRGGLQIPTVAVAERISAELACR